jgi:hydroxyacylglutathione hydrolase
LWIKTFPVGPLQCNCSVVADLEKHEAIVIDPGGDVEIIQDLLKQHQLKVTQIVHTHAHFDHFMASGQLHQQTQAPLCLHKSDLPLWQNLKQQCARYNLPYIPVEDPHQWLQDDMSLSVGQYQGCVLHTPGHTPGSSSFWFPSGKTVFAGDTLFRRSVGRTDLWGGDTATLIKAISEKLYTLPDETLVVTGHGPGTTIFEEKTMNPYVRS